MAEEATLTDRQQEVLEGLRKGEEPRDIAKRMGISPNGVYQHRRRLIEKGLLTRSGKPRTSNGRPGNGSDAPAAQSNGAMPEVLKGTAKTLEGEHDRISVAVKDNQVECQRIDKQMAELAEARKLASAEAQALAEADRALTEAREKVGA